MMFARLTKDDGTNIFLLGLTRMNVEKLTAGKPIHVRREIHGEGVPEGWEIVLMFGATELAMHEEFKRAGAITAETKVNIDPRLNDT